MRKPFDYSGTVNAFRAEILRKVLADSQGNQCAAARFLGIHRNTMTRQMQSLGIERQAEAALRKGRE